MVSRRVIDYADVVRVGRECFIRDGTLDMPALASELGVSRATLYRVIEGRDALLGDVLWSFGAEFFARACEGARQSGVERILEIQRHLWVELEGSKALRRFVDEEFETVVRVLFTPAGQVHERFVEATRDLLLGAIEAGELAPGLDVDDLAYVIVRTFESLWFADLSSGRAPDVDVAEHVARAVLTAR